MVPSGMVAEILDQLSGHLVRFQDKICQSDPHCASRHPVMASRGPVLGEGYTLGLLLWWYPCRIYKKFIGICPKLMASVAWHRAGFELAHVNSSVAQLATYRFSSENSPVKSKASGNG
jgi:hypothetical protein